MKHVVIVGAGGAGLIMLEQLLRSGSDPLRITLIDPDFATHKHKTWCQWLAPEEREPFHGAVWKNILFCSPGYERVLKPRDHAYAHTSGPDFRHHVLHLDTGHHQIEWVEGEVNGFSYDGPGLAHVHTNGPKITCDWIFTSWFPGSRFVPSMWQHFHGWMIETDQPAFDAETMTLMDFDVRQDTDGVVFGYVLPFSSTQALVEITCFSPRTWSLSEYESRLEEYIRDRYRLDGKSFRILSTETGQIPMDAIQAPEPPNPATFPIGTIAGAVKPSTGYAFARMQRTCRHLAETLAQNGTPTYPAATPKRFAFYDSLLLRIFRESPHSSIPIFTSLFSKVPIDLVYRFLDEKTTLRQESLLFLRLPLTPFLKSLWRHVTS